MANEIRPKVRRRTHGENERERKRGRTCRFFVWNDVRHVLWRSRTNLIEYRDTFGDLFSGSTNCSTTIDREAAYAILNEMRESCSECFMVRIDRLNGLTGFHSIIVCTAQHFKW